MVNSLSIRFTVPEAESPVMFYFGESIYRTKPTADGASVGVPSPG